MLKLKIKNPFSKLLLDGAIDLVRPLNISSMLEIGETQIALSLKKAKIGKSHEKLTESELVVSKLKQNSFDLVIISDFLSKTDSKKLYKDAQKVSSKYVLITQETNLFNFFQYNKKILKIIKIRGMKIVTKKILPTGIILIVKKQGNRA